MLQFLLKIKTNLYTSDIVSFFCSLKNNETYPTGMLLYEFEIPNGFELSEFDKSLSWNSISKKSELSDGSFNVYYDDVRGVCFTRKSKKNNLCYFLKKKTVNFV